MGRPNNSLKPSPLRGLGAARYDWTIAKAAKRPGLAQALYRMKNLVFLTALLLTACSQQVPRSFDERVASAEALEKTSSGLAYVSGIVEENGRTIDAFIGKCYPQPSLQQAKFQLIADVTSSGKVENVLVRPESEPTKCFARMFSQLQINLDRPPGFEKKSFPIYINVTYNK